MNIKKLVILLGIVAFLVLASGVEARTVKVRGYVKPNTGRYVAPHYKTSPNKTKLDNYSTKGNYNPYTGRRGTRSLWR